LSQLSLWTKMKGSKKGGKNMLGGEEKKSIPVKKIRKRCSTSGLTGGGGVHEKKEIKEKNAKRACQLQ